MHQRRVFSLPSPSSEFGAPFFMLKINNVTVRALVDTGCEQSAFLESFCKSIGLRPGGSAIIVSMFNGVIFSGTVSAQA